jgi:hypothetical protein
MGRTTSIGQTADTYGHDQPERHESAARGPRSIRQIFTKWHIVIP